MKPAENVKTHLRASWRGLMASLLRLTARVRSGLELRVQRPPAK
jgi:hypothetical protein